MILCGFLFFSGLIYWRRRFIIFSMIRPSPRLSGNSIAIAGDRMHRAGKIDSLEIERFEALKIGVIACVLSGLMAIGAGAVKIGLLGKAASAATAFGVNVGWAILAVMPIMAAAGVVSCIKAHKMKKEIEATKLRLQSEAANNKPGRITIEIPGKQNTAAASSNTTAGATTKVAPPANTATSTVAPPPKPSAAKPPSQPPARPSR